MRFPLLKQRARPAAEAAHSTDDRDLIASYNEARNDVQRERAIRAARARSLAAGRR